MTLTADEFIRQFLLHVMPAGFKHIRSYGLRANWHRSARLATYGRLSGVVVPEQGISDVGAITVTVASDLPESR